LRIFPLFQDRLTDQPPTRQQTTHMGYCNPGADLRFCWYTSGAKTPTGNPMDSPNLRERAYRHIHGQIASGSLAGGSQVSELSLAKALGISRTPVRDAIRQLINEGLLEQIPRGGTIVRIPDRSELTELYEIREALESYAVARAAQRIAPADLELLGGLLHEMRRVARETFKKGGPQALEGEALWRFLAADMAFHQVLIRATGNRRILKIVSDMGVLVRIFGHRRQLHTLGIVRRTCRFHAKILRAVRRGDSQGARRWTVRHLRASKRQALDVIQRENDPQAELPSTALDDLLEGLGRMTSDE